MTPRATHLEPNQLTETHTEPPTETEPVSDNVCWICVGLGLPSRDLACLQNQSTQSWLSHVGKDDASAGLLGLSDAASSVCVEQWFP